MGGGHHNGHHHEMVFPKVPDWRKYRVEDVPELMWTKKALAMHGLKDPWLRNEVWRYTTLPGSFTIWRWVPLVFYGIRFGLPAAILSTIYTKYTDKHHEHHDEEHEIDVAHH